MYFPISLGLAGLWAQAAPLREVTVYNQGFALIKDVRTLDLIAGRQSVNIVDVASQVDPVSVGIRCLDDPKSFTVLEQNYQYDLISPIAILNKAVGGRVRLRRTLPNGVREMVEGTLLSAPTSLLAGSGGGQTYNGMVLKMDDGSYALDPSGEVELTYLPKGLISRPTLVWDLDCNKPGKHEVELSYITGQMSWTASYVLTLDEVMGAELRGWVSITNNSGADFEGSKLKLLAGEVNRPAQNRPGGFGRGGAEGGKAMADFVEETLFEYHLYSLERPATLKNKELKQISLLEGKGVKTDKKIIFDSMRDFGFYYPGEGEVGTGMLKPMVRVEFVNSKANNLGMPMPKGTVKVYMRDKSGSVQMLGEDAIDHTPRDERISLFVGRSFDVVGSRKRTAFRWADGSRRNTEEDFEIEVRNRKETAERVHVLERHYSEWSIPMTSAPFTKLDATTMEYVLDLKPNEVKTIRYTCYTKW